MADRLDFRTYRMIAAAANADPLVNAIFAGLCAEARLTAAEPA
jgi:hypothetical protein